jgi:hypothetical protein
MNNIKHKPVLVRRAKLSLLAVVLSILGVSLTSAVPVSVAAMPVSGSYIAQAAGNGPPAITVPSNKPDQCPKGECIIKNYINPAIKALTATAGVIAVISLIVAGIQYSSAGGDPGKVGAAKARIGKTIGAFLFFIFLYVFLNYIVPGGV